MLPYSTLLSKQNNAIFMQIILIVIEKPTRAKGICLRMNIAKRDRNGVGLGSGSLFVLNYLVNNKFY